MLAESEIQALSNNLGASVRDLDNLQNLIRQFGSLLDSYNTLKSDYEEEKESREKYKRLARGQDRNPFVLVLVDGDGYLFKDHLIKAGSEGGITAAALLSDSIRDLLHDQMGPQAEQCRIMVRVYSNILGLSKQLARSGLLGHEARSLSPFAASFTRSRDLFDYIDAGDKKEGADFKIREMFGLFAENNQCKHIFFAGCHDQGYLSLLTPYRGKGDRITLLKTASYHPEFDKLGLPIQELPDVFTTNSIGGGPSIHVPPPLAPSGPSSPALSRPICKHFQKGICRFGDNCNKIHVMPNSKSTDDTPSRPWTSPIKARGHEFYARFLVSMEKEPRFHNYIAVNKDYQRIDPLCACPPAESFEAYRARANVKGLCNEFHIGGQCGDMSCPFDHTDVSEEMLSVMRYYLRQYPCSRGGNCRSIKCFVGHHCQKDGCKEINQWLAPIEHNISTSPSSTDSVEVASHTDNSNSDPDRMGLIAL